MSDRCPKCGCHWYTCEGECDTPKQTTTRPKSRSDMKELADMTAERDMWKLEAALWRGDRDVELPEGWTFDPSGDGVGFDRSTYCYRSGMPGKYRSGMPGKVVARHNSHINPLAQQFSTWHEAMKAAETASKEE